MLTVGDIKKLTEVFATKQDIQKLDEKVVTRAEFDEKFRWVIDKLDAVFGEIKAMRQDWSLHSGTHDRIEKRLTHIESTPTVASELRKKK